MLFYFPPLFFTLGFHLLNLLIQNADLSVFRLDLCPPFFIQVFVVLLDLHFLIQNHQSGLEPLILNSESSSIWRGVLV